MASEQVPVYTSIGQIFPNVSASTLTEQGVRYNHLIEGFERHFGRKPAYVARAPGRVNLIGEHIDYVLFGAFPAAIERDVLMAVAPREEGDPGRVTAENLDNRYTRQTFAPEKSSTGSWSLDIDKTQLRWESYVKAGYYGVLERFFKDNVHLPRGLDLLVTGSVPPGSGLSSSAAMVVASTLSFLAINDKLDGISKGELVNMAMENERRVGVNSGGLDQSASVISNADSALYISFFPKLKAELIPLPITSPRSVFVCANSLVVSDKVVHSRTRYNLRVVETLVAARVLARNLGVEVGKTERVTLRQVLDRWLGYKNGEEPSVDDLIAGMENIGKKLDGLRPTGDRIDGDEDGVTMKQMVEMTGLTSEEFKELYLSWVDVAATHFQLYKRAKHVFSEAWRVMKFREVCLRNAILSTDNEDDSVLRELGKLMDESHKSCAELYDCSCHELDQLTRLAKEAGAYGSRLTGAGWGGCTVSLVEEDRVPEFITKIKATYPPYHGLQGEELSEVIFPTKPSSGACVYKLS